MRRIVELDALRGLAALAITVYHLKPQAMPMGWAPVDLFMVLSGYLITTIILNHTGQPGFLRSFYARRALRIWPLYFFSLAAIVVFNPLLPKPFPLDALPFYATFTQNLPRYWTDSVPAFNWYYLHTWSVALEEQFYLLWPALIALLGRRGIAPASLVLVAVATIARAEGFHWWLLIARCDGFAMGGLLAYLFVVRERNALVNRGLVPILAASATIGAVLLAAALYAASGWIPGQPMTMASSLIVTALNVLNFAVVGLAVAFAGGPALRLLRLGPVAYLGRISFGLYLLHPMVLICLVMVSRRLGLPESWWLSTLHILACIGVAAISWHLLEKPILRLKDRFSYPSAAPSNAEWNPAPEKPRRFQTILRWVGNG